MILAAITSALAIVGTNTPVICQPDGFTNGDLGRTYFMDRRIELDRNVCGGLLLLSVEPQMRSRIIRMNPQFDSSKWMGIGALVMLHEAYHAALNSRDEALVECKAMSQVDQFLAQHLLGADLVLAQSWAHTYDAILPASYHEVCK